MGDRQVKLGKVDTDAVGSCIKVAEHSFRFHRRNCRVYFCHCIKARDQIIVTHSAHVYSTSAGRLCLGSSEIELERFRQRGLWQTGSSDFTSYNERLPRNALFKNQAYIQTCLAFIGKKAICRQRFKNEA